LSEVQENLGNSFGNELSDEINQEVSTELEGAKEQIREHRTVFSSSLKFLLLIFLEVLIFHFAVRTNNILKGKNTEAVFKDFTHAQVRMIKVMGLKWALGIAFYSIVSVVLGLAQIEFIKPVVMYLIYAYFIGFAFLDNYLEQFGYSIRESGECIQTHFGAATAFGVIAVVLMHIPFLGPLITPFICAIAATRYGHASKLEYYNPEKVMQKETALSFHAR